MVRNDETWKLGKKETKWSTLSPIICCFLTQLWVRTNTNVTLSSSPWPTPNSIINGSLEDATWVCLLCSVSQDFLEQEALTCQFLIREILSVQIILEMSLSACFKGAIAAHCRWHLGCLNSCEFKCWNAVLLGAHFKEESAFLSLGKRPILNGSRMLALCKSDWGLLTHNFKVLPLKLKT